MNELAVYMVKPEAMASRDAIRCEIEAAGLVVVASTFTRLGARTIDALYPGLPAALRAAAVHFLCESEVEIGVVSQENAISTLLALVGESVNPLDCAPTSLRRRYGRPQPDTSFGAIYFFNALHRSTTPHEAQRDVRVFEHLSGTRISEYLDGLSA